MRIEKKDKRGVTWVVESPGEIEVIICPWCENAAFIVSIAQPAIQKVIFKREGSDARTITIGEVPFEVISQELGKRSEGCPWCGFPISLESEQ